MHGAGVKVVHSYRAILGRVLLTAVVGHKMMLHHIPACTFRNVIVWINYNAKLI